jgi:hypothetical protein
LDGFFSQTFNLGRNAGAPNLTFYPIVKASQILPIVEIELFLVQSFTLLIDKLQFLNLAYALVALLPAAGLL